MRRSMSFNGRADSPAATPAGGHWRVIRFNWTGSPLEARVLAGNLGRDRGRAAVIADGQHHRHRVRGPGQTGATRLRVERVAQGPRPRDDRLQPHAADLPVEAERSVLVLMLVPVLVLVLTEGAGRDRDGEGADGQRDRLGGGIDPVAGGAAQGEAGLKFKAIL